MRSDWPSCRARSRPVPDKFGDAAPANPALPATTADSVPALDTRRGRADRLVQSAAMLLFALGLGISSLTLPLLALDAGMSIAAVGGFVACAGVAQLVIRAGVPALARRLRDRALIGLACLLLSGCGLVASVADTAWLFVAANTLQGFARGLFWSGSQLHAVRTFSSPLRAYAVVNTCGNVGQFLGPIVAGTLIAQSSEYSLWALMIVPLLAVPLVVLAVPLPRMQPKPRRGAGQEVALPFWRYPLLLRGCWASASAGTWAAMVSSYIPAVLAGSQSAFTIGVLIGAANAAHGVGSAAVARASTVRFVVPAAPLLNAAGLALVLPLSAHAWWCGLLLVISGLGAGVLLTLGPAQAAEAMPVTYLAQGISLTGGFRAGALLAAPLTVAGALRLSVPVAIAVAAVGACAALPLLVRPWPARRSAAARVDDRPVGR